LKIFENRRKSEMKSKRILAVWLAIMVLGFGVNSVSANGTVILYPGRIIGTISVIGETVATGAVDAYSIPTEFDGHDNIAQDGEYLVVVEGDHLYEVTCKARISDSTPSDYFTNTILSMGRQEIFVPVATTEDPHVTLDFSMNPGYIIPVVTVTGGYIDAMAFTANTNYDYVEETAYDVSHSITAKVGNYLDGTTSFPMKPWASVDSNGDGDYLDTTLGDTYLNVEGKVWVNGIVYHLPSQYIDLTVEEPTYVYWNLNVEPGNIYGNVNIEGEEVYQYYVIGGANIEGTPVSFNQKFSGGQTYSVDVPPGTWEVYSTVWIREGSGWYKYNYLRFPKDTVEVPPGQAVEHNWDIEPGYVTGTVDLYGAYGNFQSVNVYGDILSPTVYEAVAHSPTNNYELILYEGDWRIGYPYVHLYFNHGLQYGTSTFYVLDRGIGPMTVTSGNTISDVDFSYGTATITVNFLVEGGGLLKRPRLFANLAEGSIYSYAESYGSNELTTEGVSTITVLEGSHIVSAYATVQDSYTRFGEFTISVEPGDEIKQDIGAPTVDVIQPEGLEHICGSSVYVEGIATDDTAVAAITVNGVSVTPSPTNNPEDPNEVFFSTTVENLELGENIITIVVTDTYDKSITVERTVIRDPCNLPPEIISLSGPLDPVALGNDFVMTGTFTDPDDDDTHTAIWDWGDGTISDYIVDQTVRTVTGSHDYAAPGVYTVTLTVTDSYGESDTEVWSQYCVVYDPSAGFVTGGGWIDSPAGAYTLDPSLSGKANFGFVSKYKKGTTVPTGNTEFQFKAGDLNFHSDAYDWLVIAGAKAIFKGTGTINGEESYKFMVTAIDGELSGGLDMFRIKIWIEDEVTGDEIIIYDNGLEVISGGSIKIHKGGST
jgi:hypothetical protein